MKFDWKRKLTSRKFWLAVVGLVTGLIIALKGDAQLADTISGCIMAAASVIAYILGEGLTDQASIVAGSIEEKDDVTVEETDDTE